MLIPWRTIEQTVFSMDGTTPLEWPGEETCGNGYVLIAYRAYVLGLIPAWFGCIFRYCVQTEDQAVSNAFDDFKTLNTRWSWLTFKPKHIWIEAPAHYEIVEPEQPDNNGTD